MCWTSAWSDCRRFQADQACASKVAWQEEWSHAPRPPPRLPHVRSSASRAPPTPRARGAGSACSSEDPGCGAGESLSASPPAAGWDRRTRSTPSPTSPPPRAPAGSAPWSPLVMSTRRRSTTWSSSSSRTRSLPPQWQIYLDEKTYMMWLPGSSLRLWSLFGWLLLSGYPDPSLYWRPQQSFNVKRFVTTGSVLCRNHKVCEIPQIAHCLPMVKLEAGGKFVSCLNFHRVLYVISPTKTFIETYLP